MDAGGKERQTAQQVLLIRPASFRFNPQTAASNAFQAGESDCLADQREMVSREFEQLVTALRHAGIGTIVIDDTPVPEKPDAVFPNNWVSFHSDGTVIVYPMEAPNRRLERRQEITEALSELHGFRVNTVLDLSKLEQQGSYLEGTGSMVLDRVNRVAYAALSSRTHLGAMAEFARLADYEPMVFSAVDAAGLPIYHTNIMMSIGDKFIVICPAVILDDVQRNAVLASLAGTDREIIEITMEQMNAFAANLLELANDVGEAVIMLSQKAMNSLSTRQHVSLERYGRLVPVAVDTIEKTGGGSVRCMITEIHLPLLASPVN